MAARHRWVKTIRGFAIAALVVLAVALGMVDLALAALRTSWGAERLRMAVLARVNPAIAGRLEIGRLRLAIARITVEHLRLWGPQGDAVAELERLDLRWSPWKLLEHRVEVTALTLAGPRVWLHLLPDGGSNLGRALASRTVTASRPAPGAPPKSGWSFRLVGMRIAGGAFGLVDESRPERDPFRELHAEELGVQALARWEAASSGGAAVIDVRGTWRSAQQRMPLHVHVDGSGVLIGETAELDAGILAELGGSELRLWLTGLPAGPGPSGRKLEARVEIGRMHLEPRLVRLLVPAWPLRPAVTAAGETRWNRETGEASTRLNLAAGKSRLTLAAAGDVKTRALRLELRAHSIDLDELFDGGPPSDFSLAVDARGQVAGAGGWKGEAVADVPSGRLDGHALGPVHLRAEVDGQRLRVADLRAVLPGVRLTGGGEATPEHLALRAELELRDLGALLASVSAAERGRGRVARGTGRLRVRIGGSPARPRLRLSAELADLAWRDWRVPRLRLVVAVPDVRRPLALDASLAVPEAEIVDMETLGGFPNLPAVVRAERSSAAPHATDMETLGGFPNLPAVVRAERSSAAPHATDMETLGGFPNLPAVVRAERSSAAPHATRRRLRDLDVRVRGAGPRMQATVALAEPVALRLAAGGSWRHAQRELLLERWTLHLENTTWALQRPALFGVHAGRLRVRDFELAGQAGQSLAVDLDRHGKHLDARVAVALALARLPRSLLPRGLRLAGRVRAQAELHRHGGRDLMEAQATLERVRIGELDAISLVSSTQLRGRRLSGSLEASTGHARLAGQFDVPLGWPPPPGQAIAAELSTSGVDLAALLANLRRERRALVAGGVGPSGGPPAAGAGPDLGGHLRAHLVLRGSTTRPSLDFDGDVGGLRWNRVDFGDLTLRLRAADGGPVAATVALGPHGQGGEGAGRAELELRADRAPAALLGSRLSLDRLRTLPVHLRARLDRVSLKALSDASRSPRPLGGWADATLVVDGTLAAPRGAIDLVLDGVTAAGMPPTNGNLHLAVDERGTSLTAEATRRGAALGSLEARLLASPRAFTDRHALAAAEVALSATVGPLAVQHDALPGDGLHQPRRVLSGKVDGRVELTGTLGNPQLSAEARAADVRLDDKAVGQAQAAMSYRTGKWNGDVRLGSANGGYLHATATIEHALALTGGTRAGNWGAAPLSARVEASAFDPAVLAAMSPTLRSVAGEVAARIDIGGTIADPQPGGSLEWRRGELAVAGMGDYRNVHLLAQGNRAQWALQELVADSGDGHAEVHATGTRDDAAGGYRIDSTVRIERFPAYVEGQALADLSLAAKAKAEVATGQVRAQVDLGSARLDLRDVKRRSLQKLSRPEDVVLVENGKPLDRAQTHKLAVLAAERTEATVAARAAAAAPAGPRLVVVLRGSHDLWVHGKDANVELGLDPGFRVETGSTTRVYGRVVIKRGRVDVVGRRFDLKSDSSLRFNGDPALPELDLSAQHVNESENVTVLATVKGSPGHLTTSLTSTNHPELTESQLYTLVVTGRLALGGGSATAATPTAQAESVLGGVLAGQLQKLVAKKLPFDVLTIESGSTAGSARVEAGKYLTSDFYVGYVGRLGADPVLLQNRNAVHLEYELGAHWSFQGEYGDAKTGSADVVWTKRY